MVGPDHLKQTPLLPAATAKIEEFVKWLNTTQKWHEVQSGLYGCIDPQLEDRLRPLLNELVRPSPFNLNPFTQCTC